MWPSEGKVEASTPQEHNAKEYYTCHHSMLSHNASSAIICGKSLNYNTFTSQIFNVNILTKQHKSTIHCTL